MLCTEHLYSCGKPSFIIVEEIILHAVELERKLYESYMDLHEIACQPFNPDEVLNITCNNIGEQNFT